MEMNRRTLLGVFVAATVAPGVSFAAEEGPAVYRKLAKNENGVFYRRHEREFAHHVHVPPIPVDKAENGTRFTLECAIILVPTAEVQAWADRTGGSATFGFDDETNEVVIEFPGERSALSYEAEFGRLDKSESVVMAGAPLEAFFGDVTNTAKPRIA